MQTFKQIIRIVSKEDLLNSKKYSMLWWFV